MKTRPTLSLCLLSLLVLSLGASAAEPTKSRVAKPGEYNPEHRTVDAFEAMAAGEIEVRVIPKDVTGGKLLVSNKTGEPLNVKIPDAFATVHVLAQVGGAGVGNTFAGGIGGQAGSGSTGGAGIGLQGGGGGGGGNFFNVAPEKVGELPYAHVCLEHGKPDPRAAMKYEMRPLEMVSTRPEIRELTVMLGNKQVSYRVAQIVAWHIANEMSWEELAAKRIVRLGGAGSHPYFSTEEMQAAYRLNEHIVKVLEDRKNADALALPKL